MPFFSYLKNPFKKEEEDKELSEELSLLEDPNLDVTKIREYYKKHQANRLKDKWQTLMSYILERARYSEGKYADYHLPHESFIERLHDMGFEVTLMNQNEVTKEVFNPKHTYRISW